MAEGVKHNPEPVRADSGGVGFLLNQAARSVRAKLAEDLRHHDLDDVDFIVVRFVMAHAGEYPKGVPMTLAADSLNIPLAELKNSADHLERIGWLKLRRAGGELSATPTQKAITVAPGIAGAARWTLEEALNGFSREEIASLEEMLRRIIRNMGAPEGPLQG